MVKSEKQIAAIKAAIEKRKAEEALTKHMKTPLTILKQSLHFLVVCTALLPQ